MKTVLLIEDDPVVTTIYRRMLQVNGFAVEVAKDGAAGLDLLAAKRPDAVLLDLMMPRVNGLKVLEGIRASESLRSLPVLVFTAASIPTMVQAALAAGANRVFDKANDNALAVTGYLHDLFGTSIPTNVVMVTNSGNADVSLSRGKTKGSES